MASARKSYPKRSNYSVQDLIEYMGESDKLSDISSNDGSSNEGSVKSVTEEEIICSSSADDDSETDMNPKEKDKKNGTKRFLCI